MIRRHLAPRLEELFSTFPVLAVMGPRQSGKTTLVKSTFSHLPYVNLEELDTREFAFSDPRGFLNTYPSGAIIDEAQHVPSLFSYLQIKVDQTNEPGQYILTGSQNFLLHEKISQSLAGRVALTTLLPLSLRECRESLPLIESINDALYRGFYPGPLSKAIPPHDWFSSYLATYVEKDVRQVKNITDLGLFQRFLKLCAGRVGQLINLSSLASDCGISHVTARSWLNLLEASYVIFSIRPYHNNFTKRIVKAEKIYFCDPGLACFLLGIHGDDQLQNHYLRGALFENLILLELLKQGYNEVAPQQIYFWRDKTGREIDCILEKSGKRSALEIKSGQTLGSDFFTGLSFWKTLCPEDPTYLIYGGDQSQERREHPVLSWQHLDKLKV